MGLIQSRGLNPCMCFVRLESENCDNGFEHWHSLWSNSKLLGLCQMDWWLHDGPSLKLTASLHLKMGPNAPRRKRWKYSNHPFFRCKIAVSFRECRDSQPEYQCNVKVSFCGCDVGLLVKKMWRWYNNILSCWLGNGYHQLWSFQCISMNFVLGDGEKLRISWVVAYVLKSLQLRLV